MPSETDVVIIGGGPAGMSAALWCADLGLSSRLFEKEVRMGGQLLWTFNPIKNYPGLITNDGPCMQQTFLKQLDSVNVFRAHHEVISASLKEKTVLLAEGSRVAGKAVIIATGAARRRLNIPGEDEFIGRGILQSGAASTSQVRNSRVIIIGGGDAAVENALILSETSARVYVVHRGPSFSARDEFVRLLSNKPNVEVLFSTAPTAILGTERFQSVELRSGRPAKTMRLDGDYLLIRIGVVPNSDLFKDQLRRDPRGYICINNACETDIEGVFAVGDVASPHAPTISNAIGQGSAAVKKIHKMLSVRKPLHPQP